MKVYQPTTDEFSAVCNAVVELLQTRDAAHFAAAMSPSFADWKAILSTNLPVQGEDPLKDYQGSVDYGRQKVESGAKALLARADALHLDFSKGNLHPRLVPMERLSSSHYSNLQAEDEGLPSAQQVEIILAPDSATNSPANGDFKIAVRGMLKFPNGWRTQDGPQWEAFPANVADEKTTRELLLLSKVAAYEGFTGKDDPALLRLGQSLVHFVRDRDAAIYEKEALMNSDLLWRWMQTSGQKGPSRKEVDDEMNTRAREQVEIARSLLTQMDDAGIDLKNAGIQIKDAAIGRAQPQGAPGSLDGLIGGQFKLTLAVKTDAKAKNGTSLSGDYILAATSLVRIEDDWKIMENVRWAQFPAGVMDEKAVAAMELENYVAEHSTLPPHTTVPEIEFTTLDGDKKMKLSDLRGKVVVLDFWATWCGPCQEPMAKLQSLRQEYPGWKDKVAIVPLSIDDTITIVRNHVNKRGWTNTFNVWAEDGGWRSKPATAFRVRGVPTTYLIDGQGQIISAGHPAAMDIGKEVNALLQVAGAKP